LNAIHSKHLNTDALKRKGGWNSPPPAPPPRPPSGLIFDILNASVKVLKFIIFCRCFFLWSLDVCPVSFLSQPLLKATKQSKA
jgi:hypothetical protein